MIALLLALFIALTTPLKANLSEDLSKNLAQVPVTYQGRIRPFEVAAELWLKEIYNHPTILKEHYALFGVERGEAYFLASRMQLFGIESFKKAPLFYIGYQPLVKYLNLDSNKKRFSIDEIENRLYESAQVNRELLKEILSYLFLRKYNESHQKASSLAITEIHPELVLTIKGDKLVLAKKPKGLALLSFFQPKETVVVLASLKTNVNQQKLAEIFFSLLAHLNQVKEIAKTSPWKMLPSRHLKGDWLDLSALEGKSNQTLYADEKFEELKQAYRTRVSKESQLVLFNLLSESYQEINPSQQGGLFHYPSLVQLQVEQLYYRYPLITFTLFFYGLALIAIFTSFSTGSRKIEKIALTLLSLAFIIHTIIIGIRCYILERPPVSNMFETVVYVPWITMITGGIFWGLYRNYLLLFASTLAAMGLLIVIKVTDLNASLENVQAILNSQYWLIVHVLMVVGSYGIFLLAAILGHCYLISCLISEKKDKTLSKLILQLLYLGLFMLIPGTILGGVWAAQSWGRFWDWDPKESWAFISSCVYLIIVHAYRFGKIQELGLSLGAILGMLSISFTWYGVNYILGTGFHSYGFGKGGEIYYYLYILGELTFVVLSYFFIRKKQLKTVDPSSFSSL